VLSDRDDVAGSQGVHASLFNDIVLGGRRDDMDMSAADPLGFTVGGLNVRRVTGRNTPSTINAVFNIATSGMAVRTGASTPQPVRRRRFECARAPGQ